MRRSLVPLAVFTLTPPAAAQDIDEELPPEIVEAWPTDGLRVGLGVGGVNASGELGDAYGFGIGGEFRVGYEWVWDTFGLTLQGRADYYNFREGEDVGGASAPSFSAFSPLMVGLRPQLHLGGFAPFGELNTGMSTVDGETGVPSLNVGAGVDFMERTTTRFGLFVRYHYVPSGNAGVSRDLTPTWLSFGVAGTYLK